MKMTQPSSGGRKDPHDEYGRNDDVSKKRKSPDGGTSMPSMSSAAKTLCHPAHCWCKSSYRRNNEGKKPTRTSGPISSPANQSIADRIAAAKAKIVAKRAVFEQNLQAMLVKVEEDSREARGELSVNVHPSFLADLPTSLHRRNGGHVALKFFTSGKAISFFTSWMHIKKNYFYYNNCIIKAINKRI